MRAAVHFSLVFLLSGCLDDQTAIRLVVDSDLEVGSEVDGLDLEMSREGAQIWSTSVAIEPDSSFPVEEIIRPASATDDQVAITVEATLDGRAVLEATRTVGFVRGSTVELRICLLRDCLGSDDGPCRLGRCPDDGGDDADVGGGDADGDGDVGADQLPEPSPDGGGDGDVAPPDGASDAEPDAETDADVEVDDGRLCSDDCATAEDGACQDGGDGALADSCEYGEDCADCGRRDPPLCTDGCSLSANGACEDGGVGSSSGLCDLGADCTDCGPRLPSLCTETCPFALDGQCQDGGSGSDYRWCRYGTDCVDCGARSPLDCDRDCDYRECGDDGCGGSCGTCDEEWECAPGGACVQWSLVEETTFTMGSPEDELGRLAVADEPLHEVTLTRDYLIGAREVHQRWFSAVMRRSPSLYSTCSQCPLDNTSWTMSAFFTNVLSGIDGLPFCYDCTGRWPSYDCALASAYESPYDCLGYRLPTEAEWENAARAGTTTATYNGDHVSGFLECEPDNPVVDDIAWFCGNTSEAQPVGTKAPNAFGMYDMLGNLSEFTHDNFSTHSTEPVTDPFGPAVGTQVYLRGAAAISKASAVRASWYGVLGKDQRSALTGIRVARTSP